MMTRMRVSKSVTLMAQIYSAAPCTCVLLGPEAEGSDLVFPLFEKITAIEDISVGTGHENLLALLMQEDLPGKDDRVWPAL